MCWRSTEGFAMNASRSFRKVGGFKLMAFSNYLHIWEFIWTRELIYPEDFTRSSWMRPSVLNEKFISFCPSQIWVCSCWIINNYRIFPGATLKYCDHSVQFRQNASDWLIAVHARDFLKEFLRLKLFKEAKVFHFL